MKPPPKGHQVSIPIFMGMIPFNFEMGKGLGLAVQWSEEEETKQLAAEHFPGICIHCTI